MAVAKSIAEMTIENAAAKTVWLVEANIWEILGRWAAYGAGPRLLFWIMRRLRGWPG